MRVSPFRQHIIATGGKKNDLQLWDLENSQSPMFKAKNVIYCFIDNVFEVQQQLFKCAGKK